MTELALASACGGTGEKRMVAGRFSEMSDQATLRER